MVDTPEYQWILCESPSNSEPFAPLVKIGDLYRATNRTFSPMWNRAGSASFTLRTNDAMAYKIFDQVDLNDIRGTVRKCIRIRRNGQDLWSGPIWGINGGLDAGTVTFSCVGWMEKLFYAMLWQTANYSNSGMGTATDAIVFGLIDLVNGQDLAHPLWIQPGTVTGVMPVRNRYYIRGTMLGPALQELSDIEAGPDMNVDPVTRALDLREWDLFPTRENIVLGYNWGPNNLKDVQWVEDPAQMINNVYVQSLGAPVGPINDPNSQNKYGNFEQLITLTNANQTILEPYAVSELLILSNPLLTYTLLPHPRMNTDGPTLFDDYNLGDEVFFTAIKDSIKIKRQGVRVFGAVIQIDDNGNETLSSLQIVPPSGGTAYTPPGG